MDVDTASANYETALTTSLPVVISSTSGVSSLSFELDYNSTYLTVTNVALASGISGTLSVTNTTPGVLLVSITSFNSSATATAINGGTNILNITASVPLAAVSSYGASALLKMNNTVVNGTASATSESLEKVVYFGDTNADGKITAADATLVARNAAHLDGGYSAYPLTDPRLVTDVVGSGTLRASDASLVLQEAVHLTVANIPSIPTHGTITHAGVDPNVAIQTPTGNVAPGSTITVPLTVTDNANGIASFDFYLNYNTALLALNSVTLGSSLSGWTIHTNTNSSAIFGDTIEISALQHREFAHGHTRAPQPLLHRGRERSRRFDTTYLGCERQRLG